MAKYIASLCFSDIVDESIKSKYDQKIKNHNKERDNLNLDVANANKYLDSGFDLFVPEDVIIQPGKIALINMGVKCAVFTAVEPPAPPTPTPYYLYARSSVGKRGIMLVNSVGIIDSGYRGNLMASFYNTKDTEVIIKKGDRIVQICMPSLEKNFTIDIQNALDSTERGEGGLGSTGK